MRSPLGAAAAGALLLSIPIAIGTAILTGGDTVAGTMIHFGVGVSSMLLAVAFVGFPVPRWIAALGAAGLAAFGATLTLQGVAEVTNSQAIRTLAFDVLGQQFERFTPDAFIVATAGLLLTASAGRSRVAGLVAVAVAIAIEVAIFGGPVLGIEVPNPKLHLLLPVVALLVESAKRAPQPASIVRGRREPAGSAA